MFKSLKFLLHYCWKFKKSYVFYVFAYQVVYALIPLVAVIFPKFIIDELMGEQRGSYLFVFTIILIGVNMFDNMLAAFFRGRSLICKGEVFNKFQIMVAEKLADCDFERLESSEFLDTKERAKKFIFANGQGFGVVLDSAVNIIGKIFVFAGLIAIIATFRIWIVLIFIGLILLNAVMEGRVRKRTVEWQMEQVPIERRTAYLLGIIEDPSYGKEIRTFGLKNWILQRTGKTLDESNQFYTKQVLENNKAVYFSTATALIREGGSYAYLIYNVVKGAISIGDFSMYVGAVAQFAAAMNDVLQKWCGEDYIYKIVVPIL